MECGPAGEVAYARKNVRFWPKTDIDQFAITHQRAAEESPKNSPRLGSARPLAYLCENALSGRSSSAYSKGSCRTCADSLSLHASGKYPQTLSDGSDFR
jgi:hypothetical protein